MNDLGLVRLSRRSLLARGAGAALFAVGVDLLPWTRGARATEAAAFAGPRRPIFLYGISASDPRSAAGVFSGSAGAREVSLDPVADDLACEPILSPDGSMLASVSLTPSTDGPTLTASICTVDTGRVTARSTILSGVPDDAYVLISPAITPDNRRLAMVLSITVPIGSTPMVKSDPDSKRTLNELAIAWESHHAILSLDLDSASFSDLIVIDDAPALAKVNVAATDAALYLWWMPEPARMFKDKELIGSFDPHLTVRSHEGKVLSDDLATPVWPVNDEPIRAFGDRVVRLVGGSTLEIYDGPGATPRLRQVEEVGPVGARPAAAHMFVTRAGHLALNVPVNGRLAILDPANEFAALSVLDYPVPAYAGGAPASKIGLSDDEETAYVPAPAGEAGITAYAVASGKPQFRSETTGTFIGLTAANDGSIVAIADAEPRLNTFDPDLRPLASADVNLHVAALL
jgi:hypothetical protein